MSYSSETSLSSTDSKQNKLRQVISAIQTYFQTKRQDTAGIINMHLESLSVTIDLSIFDPHSSVASQFFVSLYELMNKMEENSTFSWKCVAVLANICRNPLARQCLIKTYQFIPSLSRLLSDQLSKEKKLVLLKVMQDLTCGIKISWQIPHLPHLMKTLSRWIESSDEETAKLSLAVLVNLCYKNLPAIYTLMGNVEIKKIIQLCSTMTGSNAELLTCKLMILFDYMADTIPESVLKTVVRVSFDSVIDSFRIRDVIGLRQIVDFFIDVGKQNALENLVQSQNYNDKLTVLLDAIENNMETDDQDRDPECISLIFEFLNFLIEINIPGIAQKYLSLIQMSLKWVHTELVSSQALAVLKSIAINADLDILEPLVQGLPIFLASIDCSQSGLDYVEHNLKMSRLLQLLKIMAQVQSIRPRILKELKAEVLLRNLKGLEEEIDIANIETVNIYIHGIALINELAKHDAGWMNVQNRIMQQRQTHMILAQCLCQSPKEEKSIVFEMSSVKYFPCKQISDIMSTLQTSDVKIKSPMRELNFPVVSVTQLNKIDELLGKLREVFHQKQFNSVLTSEIIELYEYKLASMGNAERVAMTSVEAATERCTLLQHRNSELSAELTRSHQMLYHVQQTHEQVTKLKQSLEEEVNELKGYVEAHKGKLRASQSRVRSVEEEVKELRKQNDKLAEARSADEEKIQQLKQYIAKLEESSTKLQKSLQKKEEALKKSNGTVDVLNLKVAEMEESLVQKDTQLQQTLVDLNSVTNELAAKKQIIDTITKFALNSQSAPTTLN